MFLDLSYYPALYVNDKVLIAVRSSNSAELDTANSPWPVQMVDASWRASLAGNGACQDCRLSTEVKPYWPLGRHTMWPPAARHTASCHRYPGRQLLTHLYHTHSAINWLYNSGAQPFLSPHHTDSTQNTALITSAKEEVTFLDLSYYPV